MSVITRAYLDSLFLEESLLCEADLSAIIKKIGPSKLKKASDSLISSIKTKDPKKVLSVSKIVPKGLSSLSTIEKIGRVLSPTFDKDYKVSQKYISKDMKDLPPEGVKPLACLVASLAGAQDKKKLEDILSAMTRESKKIMRLREVGLAERILLTIIFILEYAIPATIFVTGLILPIVLIIAFILAFMASVGVV